MGHQFGAICSACGHHFDVSEGGGFIFDLLHCDTCGRTQAVERADARDANPGYHRISGQHADRCPCGGHFLQSAPPRCPKCRSTDYQVDPEAPSILYD